MRKLLLLVLVLTAGFAYLHRERLFVRDPLASVRRGDVEEAGAQVFVNYNNDVLLENDRPPAYLTVLQHGQPVGSPDSLKCIHYLVCLAEADPVPQSVALPGARLQSMTPQAVEFRDGEGRQVRVQLR